MSVTLKIKVGAALVEITGETLQDCIKQGSGVLEGVEQIQKAGLDPSKWSFNHRTGSNNDGTYDFYELRGEGKRVPLGETKDGNRLYPKGVEEQWSGEGSSGGDGGGWD